MLQSSRSAGKLVKPLKIAIFGPSFHSKGISMGPAQNEEQFFGRNESRLSAFRNFLFIKISYVLAELLNQSFSTYCV